MASDQDRNRKINVRIVNILGLLKTFSPEDTEVNDYFEMIKKQVESKPDRNSFSKHMIPLLEKHKGDIDARKDDVVKEKRLELFEMVQLSDKWPRYTDAQRAALWTELIAMRHCLGDVTVPVPTPTPQKHNTMDTKHTPPPSVSSALQSALSDTKKD